MRLLFIQYGDFQEAYTHFQKGHAETYRDQKWSVDFVAGLAPEHHVATLTLGEKTYWAELAPELWSGGLTHAEVGTQTIRAAFDKVQPSHVILRTPHLGFLQEALRRGCHILPSFADIFARDRLGQRWQNFKLRRALSNPKINCISNHSLNASRSLVEVLGLDADKVVPWDWNHIPPAETAKTSTAKPNAVKLFYAGLLSQSKGVGDLLRAIALCRKEGVEASITLAGPGEAGEWQAEAAALDIAEHVRLAGLITNQAVRDEMRAHDIVVVPSRHDYAEGLPNTIYEGLASRSPLIISDHPAFAGRLTSGEDCLVFKAQEAEALARCILKLCTDPALYHALSQNAPIAANRLYIGLEWTDLVTKFLKDPQDQTGWVKQTALSTLHFA